MLGDTRSANSLEVLTSGMLPVFEEASVLYANEQSTEAAMILWQAIKENQLGRTPSRRGRCCSSSTRRPAGVPNSKASPSTTRRASRVRRPPGATTCRRRPRSRPLTARGSTIVFPIKLDAQAVKQIEQMQRAAQRNRPAEVDFSKVTASTRSAPDLLLRVLVDFRKNAAR